MIDKNEWFEIGAIALGAFALYVVMSRGGGSMRQSPDDEATLLGAVTSSNEPLWPSNVNYLGYNYGSGISAADGENASANAVNPATVNSTDPSTASCSCNTGSQTIWSGAQSYADYIEKALQGDLDAYQANVFSALPTSLQGQINNQAAVTLQEVASGQFVNNAFHTGDLV